MVLTFKLKIKFKNLEKSSFIQQALRDWAKGKRIRRRYLHKGLLWPWHLTEKHDSRSKQILSLQAVYWKGLSKIWPRREKLWSKTWFHGNLLWPSPLTHLVQDHCKPFTQKHFDVKYEPNKAKEIYYMVWKNIFDGSYFTLTNDLQTFFKVTGLPARVTRNMYCRRVIYTVCLT